MAGARSAAGQIAWRAAAVLLSLGAAGAAAEVVSSSDQGFVSRHQLELPAAPARVWQALTAEIGDWWDPAHSYSGDGTALTLEPRAGGCFCERLADGGTVEHLRVVFAAPDRTLRLTGGLGPLQALGATGAMTFQLTPLNGGATRLDYTYAVHGYAAEGLAALAEPVDRVQLGQLRRLADWLGRPAEAPSG